MKTLNLTLHKGGQRVERGQLAAVKTPEATRIWRPIAHEALLDGVQGALVRAGYRVIAEAHALAKDGQRYFGMLQLAAGSDRDDYSFVTGIRNSHDQSFLAGIAAGTGVFVCDNLAFSGEITVGRKHTTNLHRDLPRLIDGAVGRLADLRIKQDHRIDAYKATELTDAKAHDLLVQALDARVCGVTMLPDVLKEWRSPRHPEFAARKDGWRLFNAFTESLKGRSIFALPGSTQALHGIMDVACGLNLN